MCKKYNLNCAWNIHIPLLGLPFKVYNTFVVEERHGFNKQTAAFYAKDQVKKFLVGQAIQAPILAGIIKVINPYLYK